MASVLGLLLLLAVPATLALNSYAGPYIAYTKRFYHCIEGCEGGWEWRGRVTYFNPTRPRELQRLTGYVHITNDTAGFDDTLWIKVVLDTRSNNQWKENAFIFSFPSACSAVRDHIPSAYKKLFGGVSSQRGRCIVPPANYSFENEPIQWVFPHFPVLPYGDYRFRLTTGRLAAHPLACLCVDCVAIPKI